MNQKRFFGLCILCTIFLMTFLIIPTYANEDPITLTFADYQNPNELGGRYLSFFKEELENKTDGKVQLKIFWTGSLLTGKEILRGIEDGVADMGIINANYYPNQLPIGGMFAVVVRGPVTFEAQINAYQRAMEEVQGWKEEFLSHNQLPLSIYCYIDKAVFSTKPTSSLADFKGQKMRASSRWVLDLMASVDATPVSVPWADCYMALQTGTIDSVLTNLDGMYNTKLFEVAPNILLLDGLWVKTPLICTINIDVWNSLSKEIQGQIMEAFEATFYRYKEIWVAETERIIEGLNKEGCVVNTMPMEDMEKWLTSPAVDEIQATWDEMMKGQGFENAEEILEKVKNIVDEVIENEALNK
ncbi:Solute-binding protein [subsurface metagenome]